MAYIVDGYNVLLTHFSSALKRYGFQRARTHFLMTLSSAAKQHSGTEVIVVFDSSFNENSFEDFSPLRVLFTPPSADVWIISKIREGGKYTVVTDDREIILAAVQGACSRISTAAFLTEMRMNPPEEHSEKASASRPLPDEDKPPIICSLESEAKAMGLDLNATFEIGYKPKRKKRT